MDLNYNQIKSYQKVKRVNIQTIKNTHNILIIFEAISNLGDN